MRSSTATRRSRSWNSLIGLSWVRYQRVAALYNRGLS
jgi:hypothetical protein